MCTITPETKEEETHLAEEHDLKKTIAFIRNNTDKKRSSGAERVARHRQKKKDKGLVEVDVPIHIAEEIKRTGSFEAWSKQFTWVRREKVKHINQAIETAKKVYKLPKWIRWLLDL